jgi:homoserine kinase type II
MGVRTQINLEDANKLIQTSDIVLEQLKETSDGISDSTYIGQTKDNKKCIFKIYEFANKSEVINEIGILNTLKNLPTPKPLTNEKQVTDYQKKPVAVYSFLEGQSYDQPNLEQVKKIGLFLGEFHSFSKDIRSVNKNIYSQMEMKVFIENIMNCNHKEAKQAIKDSFFHKYNLIKKLSLDENCVIHGDLFPDNAKFIGNELSGVFDFVEACNGHFFFDLAVVINSWCFDEYNLNKNKFNAVLDEYNKKAPKKVEKEEIKQYMMYAALFYACQRFNTKYIEKRDADVKDYNEYLIKFDEIQSTQNIYNLWGNYIYAKNNFVDTLKSTNNIVGEYGEYLAKQYLNARSAKASEKSYDLLVNKTKYQVKTRMSKSIYSQTLGIVRSFEFNYLIIVLF